MHLGKKPFENIVGKGEIACTGNVSFSHDVFYSIKAEIIIFVPCSLSSANTFNLVLVQILVRGNGLRVLYCKTLQTLGMLLTKICLNTVKNDCKVSLDLLLFTDSCRPSCDVPQSSSNVQTVS